MVTTNGWADVYGVTGGESGSTIRVTNSTDFLNYAKSSTPYVIEVSGTIALPAGMHSLQSNKTIVGVGTNARITTGGFHFLNKTNVIVKNITFRDQTDDAIAMQGTTGFLVTNNDFAHSGDGLVDINFGADYGTVCWNRFSNHSLTLLIGHSDTQTTDRGKLRVTVHHNYFDGVEERQPRVRFGQVHVYNNYHRGQNSLYAIGIGDEAKIYSECNYFDNIPATYYLDDAVAVGYAKDTGSYFVGAGSSTTWRPSGVTWDPKTFYNYPTDEAVNVKSVVMKGAGIIKGAAPSSPFILGNNFSFTDKNGALRKVVEVKDLVTVPTSSTATGVKGDFAADANYFYVCYNTNLWIRVPKSGTAW